MRLANLLSLLTLEEKLTLLYSTVPAIPRLNISHFEHSQECLHGLQNRRSGQLSVDGAATSFPQSIGLAASWNRTVFSEIGRIISDEARAKRNLHIRSGDPNPLARTYLVCWTPVVNILKDPRWGRAPETYGESAFLTYALTSPLLAGLHGDDPQYTKIAPVLKHYAAYDGPEEGRYGFNAQVSSARPARHVHLRIPRADRGVAVPRARDDGVLLRAQRTAHRLRLRLADADAALRLGVDRRPHRQRLRRRHQHLHPTTTTQRTSLAPPRCPSWPAWT